MTPEVCGVGNKVVNIMNYVALSVIYQLCDVAYVSCEEVVIPPGSLISSIN